MATRTSIDKDSIMNPRDANILEEARFRKIAIQNMQRDQLEASSVWRDKQMKSYGNLISITPAIPLSKIITDETQAESQNDFLIRQHAIANISTIADQANADYIIDRLSPEQQKYMNDYWMQVMKQIRKNNSRMDKNVFVNTIVKMSNENPDAYKDSQGEVPDELGVLAERPTITARKETKATEAQRVQDVLDLNRAKEDAEMARQEEEGKRLNVQRDRRQLDERLRQHLNERALRVIPAVTEAQRAGLNEAILLAQRQAIRDRQLERDAGGNAFRIDPLGDAIPPAVEGSEVAPAREPPFMSPAKKPVGDAISQAFHMPEISEEDAITYAVELEQMNANAERMHSNKLKNEIKKVLKDPEYKGPSFEQGVEDLRKTFHTKYLAKSSYEAMYVVTMFYKMKNNLQKDVSSSSGKGLIKRVIRGRGYVKHEHPIKKPQRHYIGTSYYVDLNKLQENILCVKYASNDAIVPSSRNQLISDKTKEIINDILSDRFDDRIFQLLTAEEKRIVKRFIKSTKLDIMPMDEDDKEFQRQFEIVRGEYLSGNDSPEIKATLKRYVIEAMKENKLPKHEGFALIYTLSL